MQITQSRNAKTLTPSHMKQCILSESRFDFLKDLVKNVPDASIQEDNENNAAIETQQQQQQQQNESDGGTTKQEIERGNSRRLSKTETEVTASLYVEQSASSSGRTPVIQYVPKLTKVEPTSRLNFSVDNLVNKQENKLQVDVTNIPPPLVPTLPANNTVTSPSRLPPSSEDNPPQLIPISHNFYAQNNSGDNLYIDEDYDN